PFFVRSASLCSPRRISPSRSSRLSISPADAPETPRISATRPRTVGARPPPARDPLDHFPCRRARNPEHLRDTGRERRRTRALRRILADRKRQEVDRLEVLVDGVSVGHAVTACYLAGSPLEARSAGGRGP